MFSFGCSRFNVNAKLKLVSIWKEIFTSSQFLNLAHCELEFDSTGVQVLGKTRVYCVSCATSARHSYHLTVCMCVRLCRSPPSWPWTCWSPVSPTSCCETPTTLSTNRASALTRRGAASTRAQAFHTVRPSERRGARNHNSHTHTRHTRHEILH